MPVDKLYELQADVDQARGRVRSAEAGVSAAVRRHGEAVVALHAAVSALFLAQFADAKNRGVFAGWRVYRKDALNVVLALGATRLNIECIPTEPGKLYWLLVGPHNNPGEGRAGFRGYSSLTDTYTIDEAFAAAMRTLDQYVSITNPK